MYYEDLKMCNCVTEKTQPITAYHDDFGYCGLVKHFNPQGGDTFVQPPSDTAPVSVAQNAITWINTSADIISKDQTEFIKTSTTVTMTSTMTGVANTGWNFTNKINVTGGGNLFFDTSKLTVGKLYRFIVIYDTTAATSCRIYVNGIHEDNLGIRPISHIAETSFTNNINSDSPNLRCITWEFPTTYTGTFNIRAIAFTDPEVITLTGSAFNSGAFKENSLWYSNNTAKIRYPILPMYSGSRILFSAHSDSQYPNTFPDIDMYKVARITGQVVNTSANASANFSSVAMITYDATNTRWIISTSVSASDLSFNINVYADYTGKLINAEITGLSSGFVIDLYQIEVGSC